MKGGGPLVVDEGVAEVVVAFVADGGADHFAVEVAVGDEGGDGLVAEVSRTQF